MIICYLEDEVSKDYQFSILCSLSVRDSCNATSTGSRTFLPWCLVFKHSRVSRLYAPLWHVCRLQRHGRATLRSKFGAILVSLWQSSLGRVLNGNSSNTRALRCVDAALGSCLDSHSPVSSVFPGRAFGFSRLIAYPGLWKNRLLLLSGSCHATGFLFFHANPCPCADLPTLPCFLPPQAGSIFL